MDFIKSYDDGIIRILKFLYEDVKDAGGDGDALWYTRYYSIDDILEVLNVLNYPYFKIEVSDDKKTIFWGEGQEGIVITTDESIYLNAPKWQQILIKY